ncbi:ABC transporter substrate-binding protein [Phyllobacterium sp. K27]
MIKFTGKLAKLIAVTTTSILMLGSPLNAKPLRIAIGGAFTSMDPHFHNATPNHTIAMHVFDRLIDRLPDTSLTPGLAESWEAVSDTEWLFKLRPGVKWHDGKPFTAQDVAFTYTRAKDVPNSPGGFGGFLREVASVEVVDDLTLKIHTPTPAPNLPRNIAFVPIISKHVGETATTADYNSGKAMIGTGPYSFVSYAPGDRVEYARNDDWWGPKQPWEKLTIRMISNAGARVAALMSGDVDVIDTPPSGDLERLRNEPNLSVFSIEGMRVIYVALNVGEKMPPALTGSGSKPVEKNPLRDVRVRKALSYAINREGLAMRIMKGAAIPTGQWLAEGQFGYAANVAVPTYDPERAKTMLTEAGFPKGFSMTLFGPNDRYPNDAATVQAIAQMWTKIGVKTAVDTQPWPTFAGLADRGDFPAALQGWGSPTGEAGYLLTNVLHTNSTDSGLGIFNKGSYSNPELDTAIVTAMSTLGDAKREQLLVKAVEMTDADQPIIPLFMLRNNWATRDTVKIDARRDERTLAMDVHPAQ